MFRQISGAIGSIFASLCCLGFAPLVAVLSGAGLGFIVSDAVLIPLLALALAVALWGIRGSQKKHGQRAPFLVGLGGAIAALVGLFVFVPLHVTGLILLVGASVWDIILLRRVPSSCDTPSR